MQVSVAQLKARLSAYLSQVQDGQEVLVTDRGKPVARIVPYEARDEELPAWLRRLAAMGRVRLPAKPLSGKQVQRLLAGPRARSSRSVVEALLEERGEGDR